MKKVFKLITAPIVLLFKTLNGAREFIEDRLADVLDCVGECDKVDEIEKELITAGIKAGLTYFFGQCPLDNDRVCVIADSIVEKGINKINSAASKQLRK